MIYASCTTEEGLHGLIKPLGYHPVFVAIQWFGKELPASFANPRFDIDLHPRPLAL